MLLHLLDKLILIVVLGSLFLELLLLALGLLFLLVLHLSAVMVFIKFFFEFGVEFGDIQFFVAIDVAVHLCLVEGLVESHFFFCLVLRLHVLFVALD